MSKLLGNCANIIDFPANAEVRQVNRFMHPDTTLILYHYIRHYQC